MALPKLIVLATERPALRRFLVALRSKGLLEVVSVDSHEVLALRAKGNPAVGLLLDAAREGRDLPGFRERLAHTIGPLRLPVVLLCDQPPTAEETTQFRQHGAAGVLDLNGETGLLCEQLCDFLEDGWFLGQFANLRELGDEDFLQEMLALFLELTPQKLHEARAELAAGDWVAARRAVHSIKSSAANLGAFALWREAALVEEQLATEQQAERIPARLDWLAEVFQQVQARIARLQA
jgi:HPt (histidine-containing phosphotransfer) domain-containing protein